jgi:predicted DNA-binding protein with PD1-like motif
MPCPSNKLHQKRQVRDPTPKDDWKGSMKFTKISDGYLVRCEIGDEIISSLTEFAAQNKIHSGTIIGIGALLHPELGFYDVHTRSYIRKKFEGDYELVGLSGNFARLGNDTILHCHAAFSDKEFQVIGGHLFSAGVAVTGEFYIRPGEVTIDRGPDPITGLNLIKN